MDSNNQTVDSNIAKVVDDSVMEEDTLSSLLLHQPPPPPPGSNLLCNDKRQNNGSSESGIRLRREWDHLDNYDRALYLDAIETAIERGLHQRFALFHMDELSEIQAHDTCGFYLWHRIFILAYENMLRSLGPRYACLTLPFWDIYRDYDKQLSASNACKSYATCSKIINDLGGLVKNDDFEERTFFGQKVDGLWYFKPPLQNLRDDNQRVGMIRYDLWFDPIPEEASILSVENIAKVFGMKQRVEFWEVLHDGIHDSVHDTIGGFMRTPASPIDPLFMPWHSTMDLYDYIWEACHSTKTSGTTSSSENEDDVVDGSGDLSNNDSMIDHHPEDYTSAAGETCIYTPKAKKNFPNISLRADMVYMKLDNDDIRDDPQIGKYFSQAMGFADVWEIGNLNKDHRFRYTDIPENFIRALGNNPQACPNGLASILPPTRDAGDSNGDTNKTYSNETKYYYDGLDENHNKVVVRQPPTFSDEELVSFKDDWIEQAQAYYDKRAASTVNATTEIPSSPLQEPKKQVSSNNSKMTFVRCLLFEAMDRDTIERWAIDRDAFLRQVVERKRYDNHPLCLGRLSVVGGAFVDASAPDPGTIESFPDTNTTIDSSSSNGGNYRGGATGGSIVSCSTPIALIACLVSIFLR